MLNFGKFLSTKRSSNKFFIREWSGSTKFWWVCCCPFAFVSEVKVEVIWLFNTTHQLLRVIHG